MKRFLIISTSLLVLSLIAAVIVFWLVNTKLPPVSSPVDGPEPSMGSDVFGNANFELPQSG